MVLTLILGDQLHREWFTPSPLQLIPGSRVLMIEDLAVASTYRYHQLRLLHTFVAMRSFRDALNERGLAVHYFELPASSGVSFWERLAAELGADRELQVAEIADRSFGQRLQQFCREHGVRLTVLPSPAFLESAAESRAWFEGRRRPFMKTFYERQRRRLGLLLEDDGSPSGGRWSFDVENRRRLPKGYQEPPLPAVATSPHEPVVRQLIATHFSSHPGVPGELWIPVDHDGADAWLQRFLQDRLDGFGPYEDALSARLGTLHHSLLSPLLNIGLLTPMECVRAAEAALLGGRAPLASVEGFIRQIVGWREFIHGMYWRHMPDYVAVNALDAHRSMPRWAHTGETEMRCIARAIGDAIRLGYNHHIQRLMVLGNYFLLGGYAPGEVLRWYLEMYVDAYDWVMVPNVMGMVLYADGGWFATKPYSAGPTYLDRMGDHCAHCRYNPKVKTGPDACPFQALYWAFQIRHAERFRSHPRMAMMVHQVDRMDEMTRLNYIKEAEHFLALQG